MNINPALISDRGIEVVEYSGRTIGYRSGQWLLLLNIYDTFIDVQGTWE